MTWIKFHEELTKGAKRGIRRALRFVYLELSLLARPKAGRIELPLGMGDVEGVIDLLGGDAREVRDAVRVFTSGPEPMLAFDGEPGARALIVTKWVRWNELPGSSTERVKRHRERSATEVKRVTPKIETVDETEPERIGNGPRVEKSREDKNPPVSPPSGDAPKPDRSKRGTRCPTSTAAEAPAWLEREGLPSLGSDHGAEVAKMLDHFAALPGTKGVKLDWPATWRNWAKSGFSKVTGPAPGHRRQSAPQRQPDAPPPSPLMALAADLDGPVARSREEVLAIAASGTLRAEEVE